MTLASLQLMFLLNKLEYTSISTHNMGIPCKYNNSKGILWNCKASVYYSEKPG